MTALRPIPNFDPDDPTPVRRGQTGILADAHAEAALIGAAILDPAAIDAALEAGVEQSHFVGAGLHGSYWEAITALHAKGEAVNPVTVANYVAQRGYVNEDESGPQLVAMQAACPAISGAASYARIVVGCARNRRVNDTLEACLNGQFAHTRQLIGALADEMDSWAATSTEGLWEDMRAVAEGGMVGEPPSVGVRDDGACAFWYRGKLNSIIGESESGKSWLVQRHAVQELGRGHHVIYLDFEKDAAAVYERLTLMGADPEAVFAYFHYRRVEDPFGLAELTALRAACKELEPSLFVVDGVTNAMQLEGLKIESNNDVSKFYAGLPAIGRAAGAAAVLVDHLVKDPEKQGKGGIGGQHKRAGVDGSTIKMVMREMPGRNRTGAGYLVIDKDAPGWLREYAVDGKIVGDVTIHSDGNSTSVTVMPSTRSEVSRSSSGAPRLTGYMERISRVLEPFGAVGQSGRAITRMVRGEDKHVYAALATLVDEGWVTVERKGSANLHVSARAYREAMDNLAKSAAVSDAEDLGLEDDDEPF